jgi:hypothetical protein
MRPLALTLALFFTVACATVPLQAAARHNSAIHTVKAKKGKRAARARKGKRAVKHTSNRAN